MSRSPDTSNWPGWATEKVRIVPFDPAWPGMAAKECDELISKLSSSGIAQFEHIGSTSVIGLPAKPIIDLIAEIPSFDSIEDIAVLLRPSGWHFVPVELDARPERRFFIKVENDHRSVHLQFLLAGSAKWNEQILFRDRLRLDKMHREEYAVLKMALADKYGNDREAYTRSKSEFIARVLASTGAAGITKTPIHSAPPTHTNMKLIFATNNRHKVEEIQFAIGNILEVISLEQAGIDIDIPEPHDTLEANASEKSGTIFRLTGMDCFSEDTGLEVEALNGEPGVRSARYAGEGRGSDQNIVKLLGKLEGLADRKARFRTVISLLMKGKEYLFEGICDGRILITPMGGGGFGYDPVFAPDGESRSFGEMSLEEKAHFSHRRKAADKLITFLRESAPSSGNA